MHPAFRIYKNAAADDSARLRRMIAIYEAALLGCVGRQADRVDAALRALESTLDYAACPELALSLHTLYARSRQLCRDGCFDEAGEILATLRAAWLQRAAA
jgi:flagellin-specific chaperone FliS